MVLTLARIVNTCSLIRALKFDNYVFYRSLSTNLRKPNFSNFSLFKRCTVSHYGILTNYLHLNQQRYKSKSSKGRRNTTVIEDDDDDYDNASSNELGNDDQFMKVATIQVPSMRLDVVLKTAFGVSRNKIETSFYQNRIYINGKLASKKNREVAVKDEVDIVKGKNDQNDKFIDVMRIEVISVHVPKGADNILVKLQRFKQLPIDNYVDNPWHGPNED